MKKVLVLLALTCGITMLTATTDMGASAVYAGDGGWGGGFGRGYMWGGYRPGWVRSHVGYGYGYPGYNYGGYGYQPYGGRRYSVYSGYGYGYGYPANGPCYGGW